MSTVTKRKILVTTATDSSSSENYSQAKRARPHEVVPSPELKGKVMSLWQCNLPGKRKYQAYSVFLPYSPNQRYGNTDTVHHYRVAFYQFHQMAKISNSSPFPSRDISNVKDSIHSVTYIENQQNELIFEAQRKLFSRQGKLNKGGKVEERLMFHGTSEESLRRLLEENFDLDSEPRQVIGQQKLRPKSNVYGRGVYFSDLPRVSLIYGDILVLCRVLVGTGEPVSSVSPGCPALGPIPPHYDSRVVRGDGETELIRVVKNPAQVLPYCVLKLLPGCLSTRELHRPARPVSRLSWSWTRLEMDWECGLRGRDRREVAGETVRLHTRPHHHEEEKEERCSICLDNLGSTYSLEAVTLQRCPHSFHTACLVSLVETQPGQHHVQCPNCQTIHGVRTGNMPTTGTIRYARHQGCSLPGYPGEGVIMIEYQFQAGLQDQNQPQPGKPFYAGGFPRTAFLPGTSLGQRVLHMLITAFKRGLTFTIGQSVTTGEENCLTWNGIHHKTVVNDRGSGHGYPDMDYLDRVVQELKLNGVEG